MSDGDTSAKAPSSTAAALKDQKPVSTTALTMDGIHNSLIKTVVKGIPLLSMDNYTLWRQRVSNFLDVVKLKNNLTNPTGSLSAENNFYLKAILVAKLESSVQANVVNSANENNARLIWSAIVKIFASNQASNKSRVFQSFLRAPYTPTDIS